jgi:hypothetical protein
MQPLTDSFPIFHVAGNRLDERGTILFGSVSSTEFGNETWIGDRWLGYLKYGDALLYGRWYSYGQNWEFALHKPNTLLATNEYQILDGYWGERAELVLNKDIVWQPQQWTVPDDHDHCAICWSTISTFENQAHFIASTGERVCAPCYDAYVRTRALTFIPVAA